MRRLEEDKMNAKKLMTHISLVIFMLIIATIGFSKDKSVESKWAAQPPTIDGLDDDWKEIVLTSEKKVKVDYAVRNNAQNLYVLFVFKDPKSLSNVNATGITLYFNTEGEKKKDHAFHFIRKKVTPDELIAYLERRGESLTEEQRQAIYAKPAFIVYMAEKVEKKGKEISKVTQTPGTLKPRFKISTKDKEIIYEFRVPLAKSEISPLGIGAEPGHTVKVGFEWGGMTEELLKRKKAGESGRTRDSEDSVRRVNSRRSELTTKTPRIPKKYSFWVDVKLAQNK